MTPTRESPTTNGHIRAAARQFAAILQSARAAYAHGHAHICVVCHAPFTLPSLSDVSRCARCGVVQQEGKP